ncbi:MULTISPECIES: SGNH/GDSL hydrolase family protein [Streptacidiphilus]|uniref:SGNH/GDSL hydrolase family protein n=2 Tax=Streptacidiphilus TaxID=228398 RepID=A0ABV6UJL3_9ACTN|nr:SGNH/GDSL hydrolase family protein [Streptacidiphilus jeojiense]
MHLWIRRILAALGAGAVVLVAAALAVWLSVQVTPLQSVTAVGQSIQVGAASPDLSLSGPGELDLFGEEIPTRPQFDGPIRPRLRLTHIDLNAQANSITKPDQQQSAEAGISRALSSGWTRYLVWETLVAAGFAALLAVAVAGVRRSSRAAMLKMLAASVAAVVVLNAVGVYLMASSTPKVLRQVRTIADLVGEDPTAPPPPSGPAIKGIQAVVLGDSTAAAIGNPLVDHPDALDRACGRSRDSFAADLSLVNGWKVLNLACSGATIPGGLLGPQRLGDAEAPTQFSLARQAAPASVFIVSIGANDIHWSAITELCAAANACDDKASTAYFQQQIAGFTADYYELLGDLAALPQHPTVLVNEYYNPFGENLGCLAAQGITSAKAKVLQSRLDDLNTVLRQGARTFGFIDVPQHFDGHQLCSDQSFVQGPDANAPLHPTAAGELAIALADQQALTRAAQATPSPSTSATP